MVTLELSMDEADTLAMILKSDLSDLRMEIAGTDSKVWRDEMKLREKFIKLTIERLTPVAVLATAGEDVN